MYLDIDSILNAIKHLKNNQDLDYAFLGLLFIFKNTNKKITSIKSNSEIPFNKTKVTDDLNLNFSYINESEAEPVLSSQLFLSDSFIEDVQNTFLNKNKNIDLVSIAIVCMQFYEFSDTPDQNELISKFLEIFKISDEMLKSWFNVQELPEQVTGQGAGIYKSSLLILPLKILSLYLQRNRKNL